MAGTPFCRFPNNGTPGHYTASEPTSSLNTGSALSGDSPSTLKWQAGALGPFPRVAHAQYTAHAAYGAPGPASAGHPCPLRHPGPPWVLGLPRPTSPVPRVPTQRYSPFAATLPTRQQGSCTPPSGYRAYVPTNSKTTSIFVNLTNPLTHIKLTPGSLGRDSLLPPITHRTMHSTFTPDTQARWPHSLNMFPFTTHHSHIADHCHSADYIP